MHRIIRRMKMRRTLNDMGRNMRRMFKRNRVKF